MSTRIKKAVQDWNIELLEQLLSVDLTGLNDKDFLGNTPLMYAVMARNERAVRVLIKYGVDESVVNQLGKTAYDLADRELKALLNPDNTALPTLRGAIRGGDISAVERVLAKDSREINEQEYSGKTPLMVAVEANRADMVQLLLQFGADQSIEDKMGHTAYDISSLEFRMHRLLNPMHSSENILRNAILTGNAEMLRSILTADRSGIDNQDHNGMTPLMLAAIQNQVECVQILLSFHANESARNNVGQSAYDLAPENIRNLLNHINGSAEIVTEYIKSGESNKLRTFLQRTDKAGLNTQDMIGLTPLMLSISLKKYDCIQVLLDLGADQSIKDQMSHTAYDRASEDVLERFPHLERIYPNPLPFHPPRYSIYGRPGNRKENKIIIDVEKNRQRNGSEILFYGSFKDYTETREVVVKLKTVERNLESEAELYTRFQESLHHDIFLQCYNKEDPKYLVLEDAGQDLRSIYRSNVNIRSTVLVPNIINALHHFHQLNIVHGDLKPENILVKEINYQFTCKLCDFDSAVDVGRPFVRTSQGDLKFSFEWVCPEIFMAYDTERSTQNRIEIHAALQMDIFNLGLVIDLLCRPTLISDETVLPPIRSDTTKNSNLKQVLLSERKLHSLIYCIRTKRSYGPLIQKMLSFDPIARGSLDVYINELKDFTRTGLINKNLGAQEERFALEKGYFYNNFLNELKLQQAHSNLSSALQVKYLESKLKEMVEGIHTGIRALDDKVSKESRLTIDKINESLQQINTELQNHMDERFPEIIDVVKSRIKIMETNISGEVTLAGNLQAALISQMNLNLIKLSDNSQENSNITNSALNSLKLQLSDQQLHFTTVTNEIQKSYGDIVATSTDIKLKLSALETLTKDTALGFEAATSSLSCKEELSAFCEQLQVSLGEKILAILKQVQNDSQDQESSNLSMIRDQLAEIKAIASKDYDSKERFDKDKVILLEAIKRIDDKFSDELENLKGKVSNIQGEIMKAINIHSINDLSAEHLDKKLEYLVQQVQASTPQQNMIQESELRELIQSALDQIKAVRTFQDLSAFNTQNHPLLFAITNDRVKEGVINNFFDKAGKLIRQAYRVHFLCEVCGNIAPSGRGSNKKRKNMVKTAISFFSTVEQDQDGYRLIITNQWVLEFAEGMKWALKALQLAGRLSGLPIPHIAELIDNIDLIPEQILDIVKKSKDEVKDICDGISTSILRSDDDDRKDVVDIAVDPEHSDQLSREERQKLLEARADADHEQRNIQQWTQHKPVITLEHVKLVRQLLDMVDDHNVEHTGLRRCIRSMDGTCAWVCQEEEGRVADPKRPNCYERYQCKGDACCVKQVSYA